VNVIQDISTGMRLVRVVCNIYGGSRFPYSFHLLSESSGVRNRHRRPLNASAVPYRIGSSDNERVNDVIENSAQIMGEITQKQLHNDYSDLDLDTQEATTSLMVLVPTDMARVGLEVVRSSVLQFVGMFRRTRQFRLCMFQAHARFIPDHARQPDPARVV
jgi:hypothetical protein